MRKRWIWCSVLGNPSPSPRTTFDSFIKCSCGTAPRTAGIAGPTKRSRTMSLRSMPPESRSALSSRRRHPFETPAAMEALVAWINKAIDEESLHPLLLMAVFIDEFLAIHPFQDGNGRLSRILTTLLLLRKGYAYVPYASLESVIEGNKELYYNALRRTQATLRKEPDWLPWVGFFLRCLKKQKDNLARKLEEPLPEDDDQAALPELSLTVLALLREHGRQTSAQLAAHTGANRNTLKVRLRELVSTGRVRRHGKARATWYTLPRNERNPSAL